MPEMPKIDIRPDHLRIVRGILQKHVPQYQVWAFGSRAKWTAKDYSDLDLCIKTGEPLDFGTLAKLQEDFAESDLPWKVDLMDWAAISPEFRQIVERDKVVVQEAGQKSSTTSNLTELPLENCLDALIDYRGKTPRKVDSGIPLITAKVVKSGRMEALDEFIAEEDYEAWMTRGHPEIGDVVLTTEAPLGEVAQIKSLPVALAQRIVTLRGKRDVLDNGYLLYLLQSQEMQSKLVGRSSGTTVIGIKQSELRKIEVSLPPIEEQRAIAHVLGTLDDKIELNRRMNQTLEDMARALFKSWFVDFDGVAPEDMQESELGLIPKGWRVGTLADLCELKYGKALKATERRDGNVPVYGSGGVTGYHDEPLVSKPTIIVGRKGTVGSLYWESKPCFPIDTVFYVAPKISLHYCYYMMARLGLHNLNTDAAVPGLNRDNAYRQKAIIPNTGTLQSWDTIAANIRSQLDSNNVQSKTLAQLRGALLSKLISSDMRINRDIQEQLFNIIWS